MQFPPLHRLRLGATVCRPCPTGVSPPDDEELKQKYKGKIDAWAKDVDCTICLGPLGLNVDHSEWQPTVEGTYRGDRAWVVVCERTAAKPRGHAYHKECIQILERTAKAAGKKPLCPECREEVILFGEPVPLPPVGLVPDDDSDSGIEDEELVLPVVPPNYVHPAARAAWLEFLATLNNSVARNHATEWIDARGLDDIPGLMRRLATDLTGQSQTFGVLPTNLERMAAEAARLEGDLRFLIQMRMEDTDEYVAALQQRNNLAASGAIPGVGDRAVMMWLVVGGLNRVATELVAAKRAAYPDVDYGMDQNAQAILVRVGMASRLQAIRRGAAPEEAPEAEDDDSDDSDDRDGPTRQAWDDYERVPGLDRQRTRDQVDRDRRRRRRDRPTRLTLQEARRQRRAAANAERYFSQDLGNTSVVNALYTWWKRYSGVENQALRATSRTPYPTFSRPISWFRVLEFAVVAAGVAGELPSVERVDNALDAAAELFAAQLRSQPRAPGLANIRQQLQEEWSRQESVRLRL